MNYKIVLLTLVGVLLSTPIFSQENFNRFDQQGKRHGVWKKYYPNSKQLRYQGTFEHGKEIGVFKFYCKTCKDQPIAVKTFSENDNTAFVQFYTEAGKLISQGKMIGKTRVGIWKYFHKDGKTLLSEETYKDGNLNGIKKTYYLNKVLTEEIEYKNGLKDGFEKYYSTQGVLLKKLINKKGELHGEAVFYDNEGTITIQGQYKEGRKHGVWKYYKNGTLVKEEKYPKPLEIIKN